MMAREAALWEGASSKPGRLLAYNECSNCTGVKIGSTASLYGSANKKSTPRRRGPAKILDIDETVGTA